VLTIAAAVMIALLFQPLRALILHSADEVRFHLGHTRGLKRERGC
jgi:hypothetical protein